MLEGRRSGEKGRGGRRRCTLVMGGGRDEAGGGSWEERKDGETSFYLEWGGWKKCWSVAQARLASAQPQFFTPKPRGRCRAHDVLLRDQFVPARCTNDVPEERPDLSKIHLTACPQRTPVFPVTQTTTIFKKCGHGFMFNHRGKNVRMAPKPTRDIGRCRRKTSGTNRKNSSDSCVPTIQYTSTSQQPITQQLCFRLGGCLTWLV